MPDVCSHQLAVQPAPEQLPRSRIEAGQMKAETAYGAAANLHRGEVAVVHDRLMRELIDGGGPAVDLDSQDAHERQPYPRAVCPAS